VLGSILGIAANQERVVAGGTLLGAYTLGLGVPFLVAGLAFGRATGAMRAVRRHLPAIVLASAAVMGAFGVLLMADQLSRVTGELTSLLDSLGLDWVVELG
jgi:cytochrome c-type biogenesis protein